MKAICQYNDPSNVPKDVPNNFDYGLDIGHEYYIMGLAHFKNINTKFFLLDTNGRPSWFPSQLFKITDNRMASNWYIKINEHDPYSDYDCLIGFKELCSEKDFFNKLLERDQQAMKIYFKAKIELQNMLDCEE